MKVNDIKSIVTVAEMLSWKLYPGDFASTYSLDRRRKTTKRFNYNYKGKKTIYLSSN
jgi:hypothetical protein